MIHSADHSRKITFQKIEEKYKDALTGISSEISKAVNDSKLYCFISTEHTPNKDLLAYLSSLGYTIEIQKHEVSCIPKAIKLGW